MAKELVKAPESLSVWESNMRELFKRQPLLGRMLDYYVTRNGHDFAHYETVTPAGRWIEGLTPEPFFQPDQDAKFDWNKKSKDTPIFFQYGLGVPPYLFQSIRALPKEALSLVVVEPNIALLAYVLHLTNVYLAMPRNATLVFMTAPERLPRKEDETEEEAELLYARASKQLREEALMIGVNIYGVYTMSLLRASSHAGELEAVKDQFESIYKEIKEWAILRLASLGNSAEDTMLGLRQMALMAPWISYGYQFKSMLEPFRGKPCIVVSAGPSLDKNIEQLRAVRDKCVIIANDAVLGKMVGKGILPHIVCTLERALPTYELFYRDFIDDHYKECSQILLINQAVCAPQIFGRWPGPKMIVGKAELPIDRWFIVETLGGIAITSGSSVAHMCHSIAVTAGASSVALIGQDLAYSLDGSSHASGVGGAWSQDKADTIVGSFTADYQVPGALGGEVYTSEVWLMFLRAMESLVQSTSVPTYDCTEGGALIAGTIVQPLKDYIGEKIAALDPLELTPADIVLQASAVSTKEQKYELLQSQIAKASEDLDDSESIMNEVLDLVKKVSAPAISPERRIPYATRVGHLLDQLNEKNPMFAFVTQSYVYLSTVELAQTRFLDSVELVERWMSLHAEVLDAHFTVLQFIRRWLDYANQSLGYYVRKDLPLTPPHPDVAMEILEQISDELGDGHDQTALRMEMDSFLASVDMAMLRWPGRVLWQCANFLLQEGRSEEATVLMKSAAADFEDMEMATEEIVSFMKDYARVLLTPDLCRLPEFGLAENILGNATELGGMDEEIKELRKAVYYGEVSLYTDYETIRAGTNPSIRKWFMARAVASDALSNGDAMKAMKIIWSAVCDYGRVLPHWAASHLDWLATNMEKFFGAVDEPYKSTIDELLSNIASRPDVLTEVPIRYSLTFINALVEHGLKTEILGSDVLPAAEIMEVDKESM